MKKGCQNFEFKLITISNFIRNLLDVKRKLLIISNFKFEASIQLWGKSDPPAKITKPFKVYIEGRRAYRNNVYRGGRGGGGYQTDGRGRSGGRNYSRANGHNGNDHRDHNQTRGNGYRHQTPLQDQTYSNSQQDPKKKSHYIRLKEWLSHET